MIIGGKLGGRGALNKAVLLGVLIPLLGWGPAARAATLTYDIMTTWYEPETQPKNTIFKGTFIWDDVTKTVTSLKGILSESMTGKFPPPKGSAAPLYDQTLLNLTYMVKAPAGKHATQWHDARLGGTFATVFLRNSINTYSTLFGGDGWYPSSGLTNFGLYNGYQATPYANSVKNAYAMIFVPDSLGPKNPNITLSWNEGTQKGSLGLAYTSYADCAPGGMMGMVCMSSWSMKAYGSLGTMGGYPLSQTIKLVQPAPVPLPAAFPLCLLGVGLVSATARRRRHA